MPSAPHKRSALDYMAPGASLPELRVQAERCKGCALYARATQTVFGEGPARARIMLIGEQPGDQEDQQGRPFVGPSGTLLDHALAEAGIDRRDVYVTNAVKHFKWLPRGKRRIHSKPLASEVEACRPWLDAEIARVRPDLIVCLGATASRALLGRDFRVTHSRGKLLPHPLAMHVVTTVHPSSVLRTDRGKRDAELRRFIDDLRIAAHALADAPAR